MYDVISIKTSLTGPTSDRSVEDDKIAADKGRNPFS